MDIKGNIYDNPTEEEIKEKKLVRIDEAMTRLPRRERRALYRKLMKEEKRRRK